MITKYSVVWGLLFMATLCGATLPRASFSAGDSVAGPPALDQWARAVGGRSRLTAIRSVHLRWRAQAFGLEGTVEEWFGAGGYHRAGVDLGVFRMTTVRTPDHYWVHDQNGKVTEPGGKDSADATRDAYLGMWSHLVRRAMNGRVEQLEASPGTSGPRLRIQPDGGTEIVFSIDSLSHLPVGSETPGEDGEIVTTVYSDWREFDGVLLPGRLVQSSGEDDGEIILELVAAELDDDVDLAIFARPAGVEDVRFDSSPSVTVPIDIDGVHIFLQARMNDSAPMWFLLDTGAEVTVIDVDAAGELGLALTGRVTGSGNGEDVITLQFVEDVSFILPGVAVTGQTVLAASLRQVLEPPLGRELDGILGYDFISRFVVAIDYVGGQLTLHDRHNWSYDGPGAQVPIWFVDMTPHCAVTVQLPDGESLDCNVYIDTGSGSSLKFNQPFSEQHDLLAATSSHIRSNAGFGVGGATEQILGRIEALEIGPFTLDHPTCAFSTQARGGRTGPDLAAQLGGTILERFTVILDYERQQIYLEPNAGFGRPFPGDTSGLSLVSGGRGDWHTFTVSSVIAGSPADKAGLAGGDILLSIDGIAADKLTLREVRRSLSESEKTLALTIRRGDRTLEKQIHLSPML